MRPTLQRIAKAQGGGAAIEYALIMPALISLIIGGLCAGNLAFAVNSLHYAVQNAARCAAVKTTVCPDAPSTVTYAIGRYSGPKISPTFTAAAVACGHMVTATASYPIVLAVTTINVPVSASACYA